jgi:NAD(P)-dependent dehydrogenase (short-subunit alcohol dehydrogenase family)
LNLFKSAVAASPAKSVDIVVANAGITGPDEIFELEGNCVPCFPFSVFSISFVYPYTRARSFRFIVRCLQTLLDPSTEPTKPALRIAKVNLDGVLYTFKLGQHYLRAQPEAEGRDRCFIFKGSIAGLIDQPGSFQYSTSKFGLRGLMRSARRTSWQEGIRVNYVAPWYVRPEHAQSRP